LKGYPLFELMPTACRCRTVSLSSISAKRAPIHIPKLLFRLYIGIGAFHTFGIHDELPRFPNYVPLILYLEHFPRRGCRIFGIFYIYFFHLNAESRSKRHHCIDRSAPENEGGRYVTLYFILCILLTTCLIRRAKLRRIPVTQDSNSGTPAPVWTP
jgi:hypothetical protein